MAEEPEKTAWIEKKQRKKQRKNMNNKAAGKIKQILCWHEDGSSWAGYFAAEGEEEEEEKPLE